MIECKAFTVAFGPIMPGWGSWDWVGADTCRELTKYFRTMTFEAGEVPKADVIVVVKHVPSSAWLQEAAQTAALVLCPIDHYGSAAQIDSDQAELRRCARIVVHNRRLQRYFEPYAPTVYVDHHVKFVAPRPAAPRANGCFLWIGVRSNLPPLVAWINDHPVPGELLILTNPEDPEHVPTPESLGFRRGRQVRVRAWTLAAHVEALMQSRAALDIKGDDFRSRHKPPAKAIDFLASGLPLALDPASGVTEHLGGLGFDAASPLDPERWLSRSYWEETQRFGAAVAEMMSLERIGRRYRLIIEELLARRLPAQPQSQAQDNGRAHLGRSNHVQEA